MMRKTVIGGALLVAALSGTTQVSATAHKSKDPVIYIPFDETQGKKTHFCLVALGVIE
jgi:hypothetical protein